MNVAALTRIKRFMRRRGIVTVTELFFCPFAAEAANAVRSASVRRPSTQARTCSGGKLRIFCARVSASARRAFSLAKTTATGSDCASRSRALKIRLGSTAPSTRADVVVTIKQQMATDK